MKYVKFVVVYFIVLAVLYISTTVVFADDAVVNEMEGQWTAGSNVGSVACVSSTANSPGTPDAGEACLEATSNAVAGNSEKSIYFSDTYSHDFTSYPILSMKFNAWGGCPGATTYYAKITVTSSDNQSYVSTYTITPNQWNALSFDLTPWEYKGKVQRLTVSFWTDSSQNWAPKFQIDTIKFSNSNGKYYNRNYRWYWNFELPWSLGSNTTGMSYTDSISNWPGGGYESNGMKGCYSLQVSTSTVAGNQLRSVYRTFSPAVDWTARPLLSVKMNTWGGCPGAPVSAGNAPYKAVIKVYSGTNVFTSTQPMSSNGWQEILIDLSGWSYINNITKIEVGMYAESTENWSNNFQIDNIYIRSKTTFPTFSASNNTYADLANKMLQRGWFTDPGLNASKSGRGIQVAWWREWDTLLNSWINTSSNKFYGEDVNADEREMLLNHPIRNDGFVMMNTEESNFVTNNMGQPFPDYTNSNNLIKGWEFNTSGNTEGWTPYNSGANGVDCGRFMIYTPNNDPIIVSSDNLSVDAFNSPYIIIRMASNNTDTSGKIYFTTTTDTTWNETKAVSFTVINDNNYHLYYVPMYSNTVWTGTIKQLRLDPVAVGSSTNSVRIDWIHCAYDNSWNNNSGFILGSARYFYWNWDISFLQSQMPRLRSAMHYMNANMQGSTYNYIYSTYWGHDGTSGISPGIRYGCGLGSNYWDLLPSGNKDFYASVWYYAALKEMANLESLVESNSSWGIGSNPYGETSSNLTGRANSVYSTIVTNNTPGFWDTTNQRYVPLVDVNNEKHDYGYVFMNLEAMYYGLADTTKATNIFNWLDGTRTITGDTSTGSDIYTFGFAPRATTKRNTDWYVFTWTPTAFPWGGQVQDGGGVLYTSYYDVMSRLKYKGKDNAWTRYKAMLDWYNSAQNEGGYRQYFANRSINMQGGGTPGGIGVDSDFTDAAIAPLPILYGFIGVNVDKDVFVVAPSIPSELTWMQVSNVNYQSCDTTVYVSTTQIKVTMNISTGTKKMKFGSLTPNTEYNVLKDGAAFTTVTADSNGYITFSTSGTGSHEYSVTR